MVLAGSRKAKPAGPRSGAVPQHRESCRLSWDFDAGTGGVEPMKTALITIASIAFALVIAGNLLGNAIESVQLVLGWFGL